MQDLRLRSHASVGIIMKRACSRVSRVAMAMHCAAQVGSLQQADLRNYLARWERPDASVFGVAGVVLRPSQVQAAKYCRCNRTYPGARAQSCDQLQCQLGSTADIESQHVRAGDFDTAAMKRMVEQYLGPWSVAEGQAPTAPAIPNPAIPPQTTAGTVRMLHPVNNKILTFDGKKECSKTRSVQSRVSTLAGSLSEQRVL